jgi:uncharacterized protein YceK
VKRTIAAILILACASGCATVGTLTTSSEHRWLYSGTRRDVWLMRGKADDCTGLMPFAGCLDAPWSFALDTALLPATLPLQLIFGSPASVEGPKNSGR